MNTRALVNGLTGAACFWGVVIGCVIANGPLILYAVFGLLVWVWAMEHAARRSRRLKREFFPDDEMAPASAGTAPEARTTGGTR